MLHTIKIAVEQRWLDGQQVEIDDEATAQEITEHARRTAFGEHLEIVGMELRSHTRCEMYSHSNTKRETWARANRPITKEHAHPWSDACHHSPKLTELSRLFGLLLCSRVRSVTDHTYRHRDRDDGLFNLALNHLR